MSDARVRDVAQPAFRTFRDADAMHGVLAAEIADRLAAGVSRRGVASMAVPGGTTPGPLYDVLSRQSAPWKNVAITLTDERWTDPTSGKSNEWLTRSRLMQSEAADVRLVPLKTRHATAKDAQGEVEAALCTITRPFDVVLLGMGTDGHIASLIPGAKGIEQAMQSADPALVRAITPADTFRLGERMTLTLRAILDARWIAILIRGEAKRDGYEIALAGDDALAMPVRAVLHQAFVPVSLFWAP